MFDELDKKEKVFSVSEYLDSINFILKKEKSKIVGEIFGLQEYVGRSYMYFSIKDKKDQSTIKCFMWKKDYDISGIKLEEGLEVVLTAYPSVYKPNGGLSLQVSTITLIGEGALKIAYEKLKSELQKEGLFDESRKKNLPEFPKKIGIITSKSGAVINDFLTNIGKHGFELLFVDSKVEGEGAIKDLLNALRILYKERVDVLVLMRGGGSLESFQAFNNEVLVRAISKFNAPVITGIGHDKDIPLASLVSDKNVSTPTAVANLLNKNFIEIKSGISFYEEKIFSSLDSILKDQIYFVEESFSIIESNFKNIFHKFDILFSSFNNFFKLSFDKIRENQKKLLEVNQKIEMEFSIILKNKFDLLDNYLSNINAYDPNKKLKQGYSIVRLGQKIVKNKKDIKLGDNLEIQLGDGIISSKVI